MAEKIDKLAQDAAAARAAGMSYGQWKAMQTRVPIAPREFPKGYTEHICECCGCKFISYDKRERKYCGDKCGRKVRNRNAYEARRQAGGNG